MDKTIIHFTDSLYHDIEQTARCFRLFAVAMFKSINSELTPDEYITLDTIICNSGICQRDLAKLILKDRANTGRILDSLEEKGFITRFVDMKNNRLVRKMGVTEEGLRLFSEITKNVTKCLGDSVDQIRVMATSDEVCKARETLRKVRADLTKFMDIQI